MDSWGVWGSQNTSTIIIKILLRQSFPIDNNKKYLSREPQPECLCSSAEAEGALEFWTPAFKIPEQNFFTGPIFSVKFCDSWEEHASWQDTRDTSV